jgi:hypothetical protein
MSDESPTVDCYLSKDLEWARNLAASMKEGYGRHNSRRDFRDDGRTWWFGGSQQRARVIGRFQDRFIQTRWDYCQIGDAVRAEDFGETPPGALFVERIKPKPRIFDGSKLCDPTEPIDRWFFERVVMRVTADDGRTWHEQTLWKRIE